MTTDPFYQSENERPMNLSKQQVFNFLVRMKQNKLRGTMGDDVLQSYSYELSKLNITEDDLKKAFHSHMIGERGHFFPSYFELKNKLPQRESKSARVFGCKRCHAGIITATLVKARGPKEDPYVGISYGFKCTCEAASKISSEYTVWDSLLSDYFKRD